MGKRKLETPSSQIRSALRKLFLRSRERSKAIKDAGYTCEACGAKQSRAKGREVYVEIHHRNGVTNWTHLINMVRAHLLCPAEQLQCLCEECHKTITEEK